MMYKDIQKELDNDTTIVLPWNLNTMKSLKVVWTVVDNGRMELYLIKSFYNTGWSTELTA